MIAKAQALFILDELLKHPVENIDLLHIDSVGGEVRQAFFSYTETQRHSRQVKIAQTHGIIWLVCSSWTRRLREVDKEAHHLSRSKVTSLRPPPSPTAIWRRREDACHSQEPWLACLNIHFLLSGVWCSFAIPPQALDPVSSSLNYFRAKDTQSVSGGANRGGFWQSNKI